MAGPHGQVDIVQGLESGRPQCTSLRSATQTYCRRQTALRGKKGTTKKAYTGLRMRKTVTWLVIVAWLLPAAAGADEPLAKGKLLVATELVQGDVFAETVILLLHYDAHGATGIVINRPTDIAPQELASDIEAFADYSGPLFWGGPVQMSSLRALLRADVPPDGSEVILESVHLVHIDDRLKSAPADPARLRFFIGYAGWSAGQLDREMARGSWHVVPATNEHVFAEDPRALWKRLTPPREHRAETSVRPYLLIAARSLRSQRSR